MPVYRLGRIDASEYEQKLREIRSRGELIVLLDYTHDGHIIVTEDARETRGGAA